MDDELVKRLREVSCGAKDTLWWQAADAIEELLAERDEVNADSLDMKFLNMVEEDEE